MSGKKAVCDIINIAVVNYKVVSGDKQANLERINDYSVAAAKQGADFVLFPEYAFVGYDCFKQMDDAQRLTLAEPIDGPFVRRMCETSKELGIYIVFCIAENDNRKLYNTAVVAGPEGFIGSYRKIHMFGEEAAFTEKGAKPFIMDTKWGPVSMGICYDTFQFPELIRYCAYKGSRLHLTPVAANFVLPNDVSGEAFAKSIYSKIEYNVVVNSVYISVANLAGYDIDSFFGGGSMVLGPKNNVVDNVYAHTYAGGPGDYQPGIRMATIDLSLAKRHLYGINPLTGDSDFRPEVYKELYK